MKIGDVVLTRAIEVRSEVGDKPAMRANFKANKGFAFAFLNLGTLDHEDKIPEQADKVLRALGWIPCDDAGALQAALTALATPPKNEG